MCYYLSVTMTTNTKNNDINMRKNEKVFPFLNDDEEFPLICACVRHDKVVWELWFISFIQTQSHLLLFAIDNSWFMTLFLSISLPVENTTFFNMYPNDKFWLEKSFNNLCHNHYSSSKCRTIIIDLHPLFLVVEAIYSVYFTTFKIVEIKDMK